MQGRDIHHILRAHRDREDDKDWLFVRRAGLLAMPLPASVNLEAKCPPVVDQGNLGSCTANALDGHMRYGTGNNEPFSRLMIYYDERAIEGTVDQDAGASLRDGLSSLNTVGACPETLWPYDTAAFTEKPSDAAYAAAVSHKIHEYRRIASNDLEQMKDCLAQGQPFSMSFQCFTGIDTELAATTGFVPMPSSKDEGIGGHAVLCVGYGIASDFLPGDSIRLNGISADLPIFWIRNSWGQWGAHGYFGLPADYMADPNLTWDLWQMTP